MLLSGKTFLKKSPITEFPDPESANEDGVVGIGVDLHPETLKTAYRAGIFPWPVKGLEEIPWFCPEERGVLFFKDLHISRSLLRERNKSHYRYSINEAFDEVINACSNVIRSKDSGESWITSKIKKGYIELHEQGFAHSIEVWEGNMLVGGIYGVFIEGVFSAESMFNYKSNASKLALLFLIDHLKSKGLEWIDIQMVTPLLKTFGGKLMKRSDYLLLLKSSQKLRQKSDFNFSDK